MENMIFAVMILSVSAVLQLWAAAIAFSLITDVKHKSKWFLIAFGFALMAIRRVFSLSMVFVSSYQEIPNIYVETVALVTSFMVVYGLLQLKPYFEVQMKEKDELIEENRELVRSNDELKQFNSFLAKNIHVPCRLLKSELSWINGKLPDDIDQDVKDRLDSILLQCEKVQLLGDRLLLHAKSQNHLFNKETVDFTRLMRKLDDEIRSRQESCSYSISVEDGLFIRSEPGILKEAMKLLLENIAMKNEKQSSIRLNVGRNPVANYGDHIMITCDGLTMRRYDKLNLYSPFSGLRSYRDLEGEGLNWSVLASIIHGLDGTIWVENGENADVNLAINL